MTDLTDEFNRLKVRTRLLETSLVNCLAAFYAVRYFTSEVRVQEIAAEEIEVINEMLGKPNPDHKNAARNPC